MLWPGMRFSLRSQCKRCSAGRLQKQSFAKFPTPKLSLHNSAPFCLREKIRRDLPQNLTF